MEGITPAEYASFIRHEVLSRDASLDQITNPSAVDTYELLAKTAFMSVRDDPEKLDGHRVNQILTSMQPSDYEPLEIEDVETLLTNFTDVARAYGPDKILPDFE